MKLYRYKSHAIDLNTICYIQSGIDKQAEYDDENTKWYHFTNSFKIIENFCIYLYFTPSGKYITITYDSEKAEIS